MNQNLIPRCATVFGSLLSLTFCFNSAFCQLNINLEKPPFSYAETEADNRVSGVEPCVICGRDSFVAKGEQKPAIWLWQLR